MTKVASVFRKREKMVLISVFAWVFAFFCLASLASSLDVSACGELNSANTYYKLTQNVESSYTCFNVTASNVTLDCQGFNINYSTEVTNGIGVNVTQQNSIVIKNCLLNATNSSTDSIGIYLLSSNNSQVYNNTITVNASGGDIAVWVDSSENNTITNNTVVNATYAFSFTDSTNNVARENRVNSLVSYGEGFDLWKTLNTTFDANVIILNADGQTGFYVYDSPNNSFYNNVIRVNESGTGFDFESSSSNNFLDNNSVYLNGNSGTGIYLFSSNNNLVNGVISSLGVENVGIHVENSNYSSVSNYVIKASNNVNGAGIRIFYNAFYNSFSNITIENVTYGINAAGFLGGCQCFGDVKLPVRNRNENVFDKITINNADYGYFTNNPQTTLPNCWCPFPQPGHWSTYFVGSTYNNTLSNSIITNVVDGIIINGSEETTILNNTIVNASSTGINITASTGNAVYSTIVKSNSITNASYCLFLKRGTGKANVHDNFFYYNKLSSCDYGVTIDNVYDNLFADNLISQSNNADVYAPSLAVNSFTNTFLNTTFNKSNVALNNGEIIVQWYLSTRVIDTNGSGIENAEVNITDINNTLLYTLITGADGYAQTQNVTEYQQNASGDFVNYTPHSIIAKINPTASTTTELTESREIVLQLDYYPPEISNVRITDVTQNTVTIAWDTSKPANETIEYGLDASYGTNYTNTAKTTTHSALITGLNKGTTYHYKIHACSTTCASTTDLTFTTVSETGGYGGGSAGGGRVIPTPTITPTRAPTQVEEKVEPETPRTPPVEEKEEGVKPIEVTPQASEAPSVEMPSPSPQPTSAGFNTPLAIALALAAAGVAYFIAVRTGLLKKKK